jgi:hypothetical protein
MGGLTIAGSRGEKLPESVKMDVTGQWEEGAYQGKNTEKLFRREASRAASFLLSSSIVACRIEDRKDSHRAGISRISMAGDSST